MKNLLTFILVVFVLNVSAQKSIVLRDDVIEGITSLNQRYYDHDGLWGYINGGADLYLEYGFEQITVFDIKVNGADYKADIYKMTSPEAAYGIFSISRYKCLASGVMCEHNCVTPYQFSAAKGAYYLSVSNSTGSANDQELTLKIAAEILEQMPDEEVAIPEIFNLEFLQAHKSNLKLVHGQLGVQNGFVRWDQLFAGFTAYSAWILPVKQDDSNYTLAFVSFLDKTEEQAFLTKNMPAIEVWPGSVGIGGKYRVYPTHGGLYLIEGKLPEILHQTIISNMD